ncbi:hypothetical protein [Spirillospora sp. CA-294931]|uniref:hypothetical protein n=1 Tax=Spirillospora sp. CA-294931 TaxID=3240042 RepID=UPI003D919589
MRKQQRPRAGGNLKILTRLFGGRPGKHARPAESNEPSSAPHDLRPQPEPPDEGWTVLLAWVRKRHPDWQIARQYADLWQAWNSETQLFSKDLIELDQLICQYQQTATTREQEVIERTLTRPFTFQVSQTRPESTPSERRRPRAPRLDEPPAPRGTF